jgi:hypothetical protein
MSLTTLVTLSKFQITFFQRSLSNPEGKQQKEKRNPTVNKEFFERLRKLLKIMIPGLWTLEAGILSVHTISLAIRTFLSIYVAKLEGNFCNRSPGQEPYSQSSFIFVAYNI